MNFDAARLQNYIEERSTPEPTSGCWLWLKSTGNHGYPQAWDGENVVLAHRLAYEAFIGSISQDAEVDHKCKNTQCVNPLHLEMTNKLANRRRQHGYACEAFEGEEYCPKGHAGYARRNGRLVCRECHALACEKYRLKRRLAS